MKMSSKSRIKLTQYKIKSELYEQLLTELAEIVYDLIGPSRKVESNSIVTGKPLKGVKSG